MRSEKVKVQLEKVSSAYYWIPMYLSPEDDFVGYDGQRMIGRVTRDGRSNFTGTWVWSNAIGSDSQDGVSQGYASTKELAVLATENHDRILVGLKCLHETMPQEDSSHELL
jgi:hypothetical protein